MRAAERPNEIAAAGAEPVAPPPILVGHYRVERLIGQGSISAVYAVVDLKTGDSLALKRLNKGATPQMRAAFDAEFQTLSELRHPNLVEIYDYRIDAEGPFYALELIEGGSLQREAPMPWHRACVCLRDIAAILGFLHSRRLLHRELTPQNLLRTANGRVKLTDLRGLTPVGSAGVTRGAPAWVPPEALGPEWLDVQSDLYTLGALGYWLLTGVLPFPARALSDLSRLHERAPMPASQALIIKRGARAGVIPAELDALLGSLLSTRPSDRPHSAALVIDRLNAITGLAPEAHEQSMRSHLDSNVFVGRTEQTTRVLEVLRQARQGAGKAMLIECAPGLGRSRLLQQLSVVARLHGAPALRTDARHGQRSFGAANELALTLLNMLPLEARAAAEPFAETLALLSDQVRARLSADNDNDLPGDEREPSLLLPLAEVGAEQRMQLQHALCAWLTALSRMRSIAILVDDFHALDEESRGLVVLLADAVESSRMVLVVTSASTGERTQALELLRSLSTPLVLPALTGEETLELLRSVFGDVRHLDASAARFWRTSGGNASYCLELANQLVRTGLARYVDGTWVLPADLADVRLPATREEAQLARAQRVSPPARALAELLSIASEEPLDLSTCRRMSELGPAETESMLGELVREGVLVSSSAGYAFVHASTQRTLCAALEPRRFARAQLALGRVLARDAHGDGLLQLRASLRLLHGGAEAEGRALLEQATAFYAARHASALASFARAAPLFEQAHGLLEAQGADDYTRAPVLFLLALAAHFVDHRYEARYGEAAIALYGRVLRLELARKLSRFVGKRLGLLIALGIASLSMRPGARRPALARMIGELASAACVLAGAATAFMAPKLAHRYADALEPFRPLGPRQTINVIHDIATLFARRVEDRVGETAAQLKAMILRIEQGEVLTDIPPARRTGLLMGCYVALGDLACWQDGPEVLKIADRVQALSPYFAMTADHFRAAYFENLGDLRAAARLRQQIEIRAAQLGGTWQAELWTLAHASKLSLRLRDPALIQRSFRSLDRLAAELPSLSREKRRAQGVYMLLTERNEKAVPLLASDEEPRAVLGWACMRGALARAHNALGQHARAKEVCEDTLRLRDPRDGAYPVLNLNVQLELAYAESGLGEHRAARDLLEALLAEHAPFSGVITMGSLHEARAWTALSAGELELAREQLTQMERWFRPTGSAALLARTSALMRAVRAVPGARAAVVANDEPGHEALQKGQLEARLRQQTPGGFRMLATAVLRVAQELTSATDVGLYMPGVRGGPLARLGPASADGLEAWAGRALASCNEHETTLVGKSGEGDRLMIRLLGRQYVALPLRHEIGIGATFAVLCLGFTGEPATLPAAVLRVIAAQLERLEPADGESPLLDTLSG